MFGESPQLRVRCGRALSIDYLANFAPMAYAVRIAADNCLQMDHPADISSPNQNLAPTSGAAPFSFAPRAPRNVASRSGSGDMARRPHR
jgi:hypothetical protein